MPRKIRKSAAGRPEKPQAEKRTKPVQIKLTEDEYAALEADAYELHLPIAIYVRQLVLGRVRPDKKWSREPQ